MKKRAVIIIDYEIDGGFIEASEKYQSLNDKLVAITDADKDVVFWGIDLKDRRGDAKPDISKMKFRSN